MRRAARSIVRSPNARVRPPRPHGAVRRARRASAPSLINAIVGRTINASTAIPARRLCPGASMRATAGTSTIRPQSPIDHRGDPGECLEHPPVHAGRDAAHVEAAEDRARQREGRGEQDRACRDEQGARQHGRQAVRIRGRLPGGVGEETPDRDAGEGRGTAQDQVDHDERRHAGAGHGDPAQGRARDDVDLEATPRDGRADRGAEDARVSSGLFDHCTTCTTACASKTSSAAADRT